MTTAARIFDVQKFSVHDGPGIRTLVFFKGCPLRCRWCANPEGQRSRPELMWIAAHCSACGRCAEVCPSEVHHVDPAAPEPHRIDRSSCRGCGACVAACPSSALRLVGEELTVEALLERVLQDELFYQNSGGGVTLGGGDPIAQPEAAEALLRLCRGHGVHTAMETCAFSDLATIERLVAQLDLVLVDIKHLDDLAHRGATGQPVGPILRNLERILELDSEVVVRLPIIPTINADAVGEALCWLGQRDRRGAIRRIDLLPYHRLGVHKYAMLGRPYPLPELERPTPEAMAAIRELVTGAGFRVRIEDY